MALAAKCCLCSDEFSSIDDLEAHISADHFNCLPFECEKCKFAKFPTEFAIKRHYEEDHGLVEYFVRYRVSREIYEKKQKVRECLERCVCHTAEIVGVPHQQQQGQISVSGKSVAVPVEYANHNHHHHQYTHQLHEGEFLSPSSTSKVRVSAANTELFQSSRPRTSSISGTNQSDLIGTDIGGPTDHDPGFDQSNLMGNLLEHIKTDMDGTTLSHFDQMYASDMTSGTISQDRIIVTTTHHHAQEHELDVVGHKPQHGQIGMGGTPHMASTNTTVVVGKSQNGINGTQIVAQHHVPASSHHSTPGVRTTRPSELPCQVCKQMVVNRSTSLMYHVNVKHLKLALFKCKNCGEEFLWNRPAANRHAKRHGGDESMIENNTEKLFPMLNKHRREYFNLAPPLRRTSTSPSQQDQLMEQSATTGEQDANNEAMEEDEGNEVKKEGGNEPGKEDESTPNAILAQLVDMTRSGSQGEEAGSSQQQNTSTASSSAQQQEEGGGTIGKQKTIKCGGCGDMVINQEWILLNHVNTKHLHLPLYKCVSCDKPFENYLRSYAVRHAKFYHAGDESLLLDQRDQFWSGLREACSRLFGLTKVGE